MQKLVTLGTIVGAVFAVAGCTTGPQAPPIVSWQYGSGNGDGVQYSGAAPTYARAYGMGQGDNGVTSGAAPTPQYSYGGENQTGGMVQLAPPSRQMMASPAPQPQQAAPGTHS